MRGRLNFILMVSFGSLFFDYDLPADWTETKKGDSPR
jgi:hypothetical protein